MIFPSMNDDNGWKLKKISEKSFPSQLPTETTHPNRLFPSSSSSKKNEKRPRTRQRHIYVRLSKAIKKEVCPTVVHDHEIRDSFTAWKITVFPRIIIRFFFRDKIREGEGGELNGRGKVIISILLGNTVNISLYFVIF